MTQDCAPLNPGYSSCEPIARHKRSALRRTGTNMLADKLHRRFLNTDPSFVERFGDPFRPLGPECRVVQFDQPLTRSQLQHAADLIVGRPDVELYVYAGASTDLDFLEYFKTLRRLHIALFELTDIAGLSHLRGSLEELTFGPTKAKFSLRFLETLPTLTKLFLAGHNKDLACVRSLVALRDLGLSGITLPDLSILLPLSGLRKLSILLGGTTNLSLLPQFAHLEDLFLMRITKLSDLGVLGDLHRLRTLRLDWMRNVKGLPSLARLTQLENIELDTMKGISDLSPIACAPALRRLSIAGMPQLTPDSFRCFIGHPRLQELWAYTGKRAVNEEIKKLFPSVAR